MALNRYQSPDQKISWVAGKFPTYKFYSQFIYLVVKFAWLARRGRVYERDLAKGCWRVLQYLETTGVHFTVENMDAFKKLEDPCVFVSNHMSALETFILPGLIFPHRRVTFIVKDKLITYPVFKHIMLSMNPIVVSRTNPREDLRVMLHEGEARLRDNISVVVFPQSTRTTEMIPEAFNSIGIKLASRAGVPVIPLALRSDAWANGYFLKDFGQIDPTKPVHICFGDPIVIAGNGKVIHKQITQFIADKLDSWRN
ncbi:MAG: 1-acyl-sn-glycerol-3-phosphate acyltransferase [Anaerolineae bacterium]|nr:1-acyl-sn-glycerol-3-phosphate acyltransferase [Anaerolineae bacterium]